MAFEPWMLAAMEDEGYMNTSHGLNMKVAKYLAENGSDDIRDDEFRDACVACGVHYRISHDRIHVRINICTT